MNYVVGLLVFAPTDLVGDSLQHLLPAIGRPLFEDEIVPEWSRVYDVIKTTQPPDSLVRREAYILLKWSDVEWSVGRYESKIEDTGGICVFDYAIGETAADDELINENSVECDECIFHLRVSNRMCRLDYSNVYRYLPDFNRGWSEDYEINADNIIEFIEATGYVGQ